MTPLLLVPGTLCDERLFAPVLDRLPHRAVHAGPVKASSVEAAADAILARAPARFVACGFSLGGFVVLELLRRAPARLAGAVLISSNARPDPPENAAVRRAQLLSAMRQGPARLIDTLWPSYVAAPARDRADLHALVVAMAESVGIEAFAAQTELAIARPDSRSFVAGCTTPLLVLGGADDVLCPEDRQAELSSGPAARRVTITGAGHFAPIEAPEAVAAAVGEWLGDLLETRRGAA